MPAELTETLVQVAGVLARAADPWWIISSAAAALYGVTPLPVRDVDVLVSCKDARIFLPTLGLCAAPERPDDRFSSEIFATWREAPLPVDFMAGFNVRNGNDWQLVQPQTRNTFIVVGEQIFIPSRDELADLLEVFARPKDLIRAGQLRSH